ncbi:MAG TPA: aminotransferase class V-fold PLP-dependent enzyme [Candidatus Nanopelagicaceae bacterium]|jgi:lysine decarboxylase
MEVGNLRASAPLLDSYLTYLEDGNQPFTTPGHKQRAKLLDAGLGRVVDQDVPLYGGLDEIKLTHGVLEKAEALAAQLWNADWLRFSTGGSTHANQTIIFSLGQPGDKVAISRTAHRSALTAIVLAGLEPIWLVPEIDPATGVPIGIPLAEVQRALSENPIALILTEPGYLGTLSDLPTLIDAAHEKNTPVIIDAAWGGHFGFHPSLPAHPMQLNADAFVTSIHKALPGYSAAAIAVARTTRLDHARLEQGFESTHTTSPAGATLASIDGVRALMQLHGAELIERLILNVNEFRSRLTSEFGDEILLKAEDFAPGRFDPVKLVMRANILGADGIDIENDLIASNIRVEMADRDTLIFEVTIADDESTFKRLGDVLIPILRNHVGKSRKSATAFSWTITPQKGASLREAYFGRSELVDAKEAIGRISVDLVAPYPPGVPVLAPGEIITKEILDGLLEVKAEGTRIAYATDHTLRQFRVLAT